MKTPLEMGVIQSLMNVDSLVSVVRIDRPAYPSGDDAYSPFDAFPEAPFAHHSGRPNPVYDAVRRSLAAAGLDAERFGTPEWNPLGDYLTPGGRVFLLCNFVYHRRPNETPQAFLGKCTHASVIRPMIDYALKAVGPRGRVEFGNAPLQSADWQRLLHDTGAERLVEFYRTHAPGQVHACDLRNHVVVQSRLGSQAAPLRRSGRKVHVDLSQSSLLEAAGGNGLYRVSQYDPGETRRYQRDGHHVYAISSKIAAADLLISIPKLKTHEKVGMTGALKGCVGAVALKQCLAHHRKGPPKSGGDEYPASRQVPNALSALSDWVWTRKPGRISNVGKVAERLTVAAIRRSGGIVFGAWPGNDTCWRMTLDLARCVAHCTADGSLRREAVRRHLVMTDGVIGGEGQGPLVPAPVASGYLAFARDPYAADYVNCLAMGFDPSRLPLVDTAARIEELPITGLRPGEVRVRLDGQDIDMTHALTALTRPFLPARAWGDVVMPAEIRRAA